MAPLGSSKAAQTRFTGGFCSSSQSMAISPLPALGLESRTHSQQFSPSSASPDNTTFQFRQQVRQFYFQQQHAALQNGDDAPCTEVPMASCGTDIVEELPKQDRNIEQEIQNYVQENLSEAPGLMRYHSAPSSMLANLTGMGDAILNQGAQLGQFLSNSALPVESKGAYKHINTSHSLANDHGDSGAAGIGLNHNLRCDANGVSHNNGLLSSCMPASYQPVSGAHGVEHFTAISTDLKVKSVILQPSDGPVESSRKANEVPSSYPLGSSHLPNNSSLENASGMAHGVPMTRNSLLRQSSSPAGLLYQLKDNNEMNMLGSSSGNSSEEGSYGNYTWDEAGNMILGSPNASYAARKRFRDMEQKYFPGSTLKGEGATEHGVLGNYFGLQAATSSENVYFPDKLSPDSVLCRARAKRGCATHPRSIAERVRRTKISERMKKLQELVPNMDKQTNTAEMLDEAVEYVKLLQRQVQELAEKQAKCKCSCGKPKETS